MANNYSVSSFTTLENTNDNVGNGTILSPVHLYITPDSGFVIQASDFSIGNALPPEAISVVFTNTTTALDTTNLVKATVSLASWYVHGVTAFNIDIDIDGAAHAEKARLNWTTIHNSGTSNVTQGFEATNKAAVVSGEITTNTCFLDIQTNTSALVGVFTYTAAADFHLAQEPGVKIISQDITKWIVTVSDQTYNSDNQLTRVKYSFNYDISSGDIPLSDGESLIFGTPIIQADRATCVSITSAYYENNPNGTILEAVQNTLILKVTGVENATYNIRIQDNLGLTYDFTSNTFTREGSPFSAEQTIFSPSKQIILGREPNKNEHQIIIPENALSSARYTTTVTPTGDTKSSTDCGSRNPFVIIHDKFGVVDYIFTTSAEDFGVNAANTTVASVLNKAPFQQLTTYNPIEVIDATTFNNGYFTYSSTLSYTVNGTVSSASSTSITLSATANSLKLQVGDSVTGTNVGTARTITGIADGDAAVIVLSGVDGTASGTLVFTRNVGISRQPQIGDIRSTAPCVVVNDNYALEGGYVQYQVATDSLNSKIVFISEVGIGFNFADIIVGMLVQGQSIVGDCNVVSISKGTLVLSSEQSLVIGDTLDFSVAGSSLFINKFEVTGAGTSNCKLNIDGFVSKMGNTDVAAQVLLNNFIATYAAPTITASTAVATIGSTISIQPLDTDTFRSQRLIITEITSAGNSRAITISEDGQTIKYLAPLAGTTDTISYKISDGISAESSAANIVITLTK